MSSDRYLIIHGHFYQPPRENPWHGAIDPQASAEPFTDWNQRICRECYAPNSQARILNQAGHIIKLLNNYEYFSFNFGPTLLSWMEKSQPGAYRSLIEADQRAASRRNGHGPALAQVYNHLIMPLADRRDQLTQIRWGLQDFERRFGRRAEGLWLAETAMNLETLSLLKQEGLKFTILSQGQASAVRPLGDPRAPWTDVSGGRIDPREPYRVFWGSGPEDYLDVFFYDGPVSRAIAFESLLSDGQALLDRVETAFGPPGSEGRPRLVNLATDGESYGHHFHFGEMAAAWLFDHLESRASEDQAIRLTNYGEYLSLFPPVREARVIDNTAWSCAHGVDRWRSDCGCNVGSQPGGNQKWRAPLREGLNWLRGQLAQVYEDHTRELLTDPWAARDAYMEVVAAGYTEEAQKNFIEAQQSRPLEHRERSRVFSLLESQLMSLYMFTSCGWFFDEISGLEPVQNLRYALRAMELAQESAREDLAEGLLQYLSLIQPNNPAYKSGLDVWQRLVTPNRLNSRSAAAHWAASMMLDTPEVLSALPAFTFETKALTKVASNEVAILAGLVEIGDPRSDRRRQETCLALHSGGAHLAVLVGESSREDQLDFWFDREALTVSLGGRLSPSSSLEIWDAMTKLLPLASRFVLENLLPTCRASLLISRLDDIFTDLKEYIQDLFHKHQHLLMAHHLSAQSADWLEQLIFRVIGEMEFKRLLTPAELGGSVNMVALAGLLNKRGLVGISKNDPVLREMGKNFLRQGLLRIRGQENPGRLLQELQTFIELTIKEDFQIDFWEPQNLWHDLTSDEPFLALLDQEARRSFLAIGSALGFETDE